MTTVATVRGPIDSADLGRTYMHEHIFVLTPDVQQNYPDEWGDEEARVADAVAKLGGAGGQRGPLHRRPDGHRAGPLHPPHPTGGRPGARPQHRRRHRLLHVPRRPVLLPPPHARRRRAPRTGGARADGAPVRGRHHRGDRRDRGPGRHAQVRHRRGRPDARGRADHACRGPGPPGHRLPDHRAHPPRHRTGPRRAAGDVRGGRRPGRHRARPQRRLDRRRPPRPSWPTPASGWGWTGSASTSRPRSRRGPTRSSNCAGGATPSAWSCPTTPPATSTGWTPRRCPFLPQWHYLHIEQDVLPYLRDHGVTEEQITTMLVDNPRRIFEGG